MLRSMRGNAVPRSMTRSRLLTTLTTPHAPSTLTTEGVKSIRLAILGGGLSGMASAFYFLRSLSPALRSTTEVIIFERDPKRTGGWCRSVQMDPNSIEDQKSSDGTGIVFETGPRSIRPVGLSGWLTVEIAHQIQLAKTNAIITIPKSSPAAKNRYIFYPDKLTVLPSSLTSAIHAFIFTPLFRSVLYGILTEPFRPRSPAHLSIQNSQTTLKTSIESIGPGIQDESVDSWFSRRFGKPLAANMISAMIHGIYSGDTRRLSMRALFPQVWEVERESKSVLGGALLGGLRRRLGLLKESEFRKRGKIDDGVMNEIKANMSKDVEGKELVERMENASVWGVVGGLEKLTEKLQEWCVAQGVKIRMGEQGQVDAVNWDRQHGWTVTTPTSTYAPTHLITTLPNLLPKALAPPPIPSATVSVVNLMFPSDPANPLFPPGFGYLIPRTVTPAMNPHQILGIIFDSDVMPGVDSTTTPSSTSIKITLILGGSYWLPTGAPSPPLSAEFLEKAALETLALHFPDKIFPKPLKVLTSTHPECIPQPPVGHPNNMVKFRERLERVGGTVGVVGGGTGAVGVNGAVKDAWEVGTSFAHVVEFGGKGKTGLENW